MYCSETRTVKRSSSREIQRIRLYGKTAYGLIVIKKFYEKLTWKDLTENCRMFEERDRRFYGKQQKVSVQGMAGGKRARSKCKTLEAWK